MPRSCGFAAQPQRAEGISQVQPFYFQRQSAAVRSEYVISSIVLQAPFSRCATKISHKFSDCTTGTDQPERFTVTAMSSSSLRSLELVTISRLGRQSDHPVSSLDSQHELHSDALQLLGPADHHHSSSESSNGSGTKATAVHRKKRGRRWILWWPETLALALSIASFAAIVVVLISFHHKRLDSWSMPYKIRPNTLISILMILCRLSMLVVVAECIGQLKWIYFEQRPHPLSHFQRFDDASRGPWGSLRLIYSVHWTALVASSGALVTVLALAMEPFAQQVLSYTPINQTEPLGRIGHASVYDYNTGYGWFGTTHPEAPPYGTSLQLSLMNISC